MLCKHNSNVNDNPAILGPVFVHQNRTFASHHFFISSLVGLRPALKNVLSFGTDGEDGNDYYLKYSVFKCT